MSSVRTRYPAPELADSLEVSQPPSVSVSASAESGSNRVTNGIRAVSADRERAACSHRAEARHQGVPLASLRAPQLGPRGCVRAADCVAKRHLDCEEGSNRI